MGFSTIKIHCNVISGVKDNGNNTDILYNCSLTEPPGHLINIIPTNILYQNVTKDIIEYLEFIDLVIDLDLDKDIILDLDLDLVIDINLDLDLLVDFDLVIDLDLDLLKNLDLDLDLVIVIDLDVDLDLIININRY